MKTTETRANKATGTKSKSRATATKPKAPAKRPGNAAIDKAAKETTPSGPLPTIFFDRMGAFSKWLAQNHATSRGLWIKMAKAETDIKSLSYSEALSLALSYGWIDGQARRIDDRYYVQKFTPRAARSMWSKINCARATALIVAGWMKPPGLAEIERAKKDGRWARAYDSPKSATVPEDLAAALAANAASSKFFPTLDARNRYAILHRIQTATKPETRAKRIANFVAMLARGEKIHS